MCTLAGHQRPAKRNLTARKVQCHLFARQRCARALRILQNAYGLAVLRILQSRFQASVICLANGCHAHRLCHRLHHERAALFHGHVVAGNILGYIAGERAARNLRVARALCAFQRGHTHGCHKSAAPDDACGGRVDTTVTACIVVANQHRRLSALSLKIAVVDDAQHLACLARRIQCIERGGCAVMFARHSFERAAIHFQIADGGRHSALHARECAAVDGHFRVFAIVADGV